MLRIESVDRGLIRLAKTNLEPTQVPPASEIRSLVLASADAVVEELDGSFFLLDKDVPVREGVAPRADLLCAEQDGTITVVLFPTNGPQQLSLALAVSGELARWSPEDLTRRLSGERQSRLSEFLSGPLDSLNRRQRIVLVSGAGDADLAAAVEWLSTGGIAISLLRLVALRDSETHDIYLTLSTPEEPAQAVSIVRESTMEQASIGIEDRGRELAALTGRLEEEERGRYLLEQRYRTLSRLAPIGIFHTDAHGNYLFVNPRWTEIAGLGQQEAAAHGWTSALHPDDKQRVLSAWSETLRSKRAFKAEFRFLRPDGISWVIAEADVQMDSSDAVVGTAGTVTELHRSRLEQQNENDRTPSQGTSRPENSPSEQNRS